MYFKRFWKLSKVVLAMFVAVWACITASALEIDGIALTAGTQPPCEYEMAVVYDPVKCASIEEISFGTDGSFIILHTRTVLSVGEFDMPHVRYISSYNASGEQQFSLVLEETEDVKLKLTDRYIYICAFPRLIEHNILTHETMLYSNLNDADITQLYYQWNVNERNPIRNGWAYEYDDQKITRHNDSTVEVVLRLNQSWADIDNNQNVLPAIICSVVIFCGVVLVIIKMLKGKINRRKTGKYSIEEIEQ